MIGVPVDNYRVRRGQVSNLKGLGAALTVGLLIGLVVGKFGLPSLRKKEDLSTFLSRSEIKKHLKRLEHEINQNGSLNSRDPVFLFPIKNGRLIFGCCSNNNVLQPAVLQAGTLFLHAYSNDAYETSLNDPIDVRELAEVVSIQVTNSAGENITVLNYMPNMGSFLQAVSNGIGAGGTYETLKKLQSECETVELSGNLCFIVVAPPNPADEWDTLVKLYDGKEQMMPLAGRPVGYLFFDRKTKTFRIFTNLNSRSEDLNLVGEIWIAIEGKA
ncbi:MAG: hypothetical protein NZT61_03565 [Deltaproteobacteria bacterium]|nr:hypothetical protein [Deltaproteobacteria bacterium]MCX7953017.1 hypothetical protein [Deltaproteobacteria bacterium]